VSYKPYWDRLPGLLARHGQNPVVARWLQQSLGICVRDLFADERCDERTRDLVREYLTGRPS
jgi:hypothetical protein